MLVSAIVVLEGSTPLHDAAMKNNLECCIYLLEQGAKIRVPDNSGKTAVDLHPSLGEALLVASLSLSFPSYIDPLPLARCSLSFLFFSFLFFSFPSFFFFFLLDAEEIQGRLLDGFLTIIMSDNYGNSQYASAIQSLSTISQNRNPSLCFLPPCAHLTGITEFQRRPIQRFWRISSGTRWCEKDFKSWPPEMILESLNRCLKPCKT